jgi:hypothetical protein
MQFDTITARRRSGPWGARAWPWIVALLLVAVFGFWKPYFGRLPQAALLTHVHVGLMLAWFALLLSQPVLVLRGRRDLHRSVGKAGHVLVPAIVATAVLMGRQRIAMASQEDFGFQAMVLFLGLGTSALFATLWALALRYRHQPALHARFMLATALTMLDPALARVMIFWARPPGVEDLQMVSYAVIYAILVVLIALERRHARGRGAFPAVLALFVLMHVLTRTFAFSPTWQGFAHWLAAT